MRFELIPLKPQFNMQTFTPYLYIIKIPGIGFEPILMAHETIELPITPPKKIKDASRIRTYTNYRQKIMPYLSAIANKKRIG